MNALRLWWNQYMTSETMAVSLMLWLCSLVAVGLIVTPWFGPRIAGLVAVGLLAVALVFCWGICIVHWVRNAQSPNLDRSPRS